MTFQLYDVVYNETIDELAVVLHVTGTHFVLMDDDMPFASGLYRLDGWVKVGRL